METKKKSFILYLDQRDLFDKLPDEIAGKLIKHIFSYVNLEKPVPDDLLIDIAFSSIKQSLKRDLSKWENLRNQRSEAGRASAEKRANEKQRKSTSVESRTTKAQRSPTKSTVSVSVSVSDSVSEKNKDISQLVVDEYNKSFDGLLPLVSKLTQKRKSAINGCISEMKGTSMDFSKIDEWIGLFDYIKKSDFLMGRKCDWAMNFDFVTNKNKLIKIIEGDYDNE